MTPAQQSILTFSVLLLIMIMGYQNCAPVAQGEVADHGQVGILEPAQDFKVGFLSEEIHYSLESDIYGICGSDQDGASLTWWAEDFQGEVVTTGKAHCFEGEFAILLEDMRPLSCLEDYTLFIRMGAKSLQKARLLMDCE